MKETTLQDLIAGQVDLMFDGLGSSSSHIKSGRIRALAVAAPKRSPAFPDIPLTSQAEFGALLSAEIKRWGQVVKAAGVEID